MRHYFNIISMLAAQGVSLLLHLFFIWHISDRSPFHVLQTFLLEAVGRVLT